ncbi:signal recognition particle-docking protein FtsY [Methylotuvimicrobium alcaliphilum]|uniref:Signal recognition particle receptor FtsY n=1 Tax=Methylotuvimicrobium alcaliphilum (strain DSM 19304 / NCIMB 14124 / VKM B-2133 / 20Z) TaxID=1091494 RepID=G4SUT1_META2|nr:signal recognition particle-docking protein FtsY [Methylotuvimicrobium alcaliphilum]CCE23990.1 Signal recognition particle-docking protein FtsY [Methylotuvimicrobium alcaliphilum 20Z]
MFRKITFVSAFLALLLIVAGSVVKLTGADLACLDWPECYGQWFIADNAEFKASAEQLYPGKAVDVGKAWQEMARRYVFGLSMLTVLLLALIAWRQQYQRSVATIGAVALLIVATAQVCTAVKAVELNAMPIIVTAQALLGFIQFWLLSWLFVRLNPALNKLGRISGPIWLAGFAGLLVLVQTLSGLWVNANHAGQVCSGFPQCNGQWWPQADYRAALNIFNGLVTGYQGILSYDAQVAAHWLHRVFALPIFVVLTWLVLRATSANCAKPVRKAGMMLSILLFVQIGFSVIAAKYGLPAWSAIVHNFVSAILMLPLLAIAVYSRYGYAGEVLAGETVERPVAEVEAAEAVIEVGYVEPEPESLARRLKSQLQKTRSGLSGLMATIPIGQKAIDDDLLEEIEARLLMADIGIEATTAIIRRLTDSLERHQLNDGEALENALKQELLAILKPCDDPLQIPKQDKPFVILVVGVNGAGKTTTIGKMAKRFQSQGHSVMLAAGDTFRAAAVEQLQTWGERNNIHVVAQHTGADSASVIYDGVQSAHAKGVDVLIADTAGRLHTKSNLMDELKKVKRIIGKLDETAPHEVLLVLDAGTGQNALSQAKQFNETVALTGIALTKLDGTAKGGVIFALAKQLSVPIRFIGIGEGIDDLQDFDAEQFVDALFAKDQ